MGVFPNTSRKELGQMADQMQGRSQGGGGIEGIFPTPRLRGPKF